MIPYVRLGGVLPSGVPLPVRLLSSCIARGLPAAGAVLVLDTSAGSDVELVSRLGPLPPEPLDLPPTAHGLDPRDVPALAAALRTAFATGGPVLARPRVPCVHAGKALLRRGTAIDVVRSVEGQSYELETASDVRTLQVPVLRRRWQRAHRGADEWRTPLPPWGMRLSRLLRDVRRVLGDADLDVEFADDGETCRLLAVQPGS